MAQGLFACQDSLEAGGRGSEAPYDRIFVTKKQTPLQLSFTTNIQDRSNTPLGGDRDLNFHLVVGEVNDVSPVDIGDMIAVRKHIERPLDKETAKYDINHDGVIHGGDIGAVRRKLGNKVD